VNYSHRLTLAIRSELPRLISSINRPRGKTLREAATDYFNQVLLDRNLPEAHRAVITDYMRTSKAKGDVEVIADVLYLMLASPEYQLA
jgi:hypothetical protein